MISVLRQVTATRYVTPLREGGSLPGVVEADDLGTYVVKFRGAGQGPKALVAEVAPRAYPVYAVVHGAADGDPQIAALLTELDQQRLAGAELLAATVADRLGGGDVAAIRDALWVLMSPLQYGMIVRDLGRPVTWYRDWVARMLRTLG